MSTLPTNIFIESSKKPNYHLGKMFLDAMGNNAEDSICQIDAATGEEETFGSVYRRTVRLAKSFRRLGLRPGDILALGGRNHLDVHIPYYAAEVNGMPILGVDPYYKFDEIKHILAYAEPKIAFCQQEHYEDHVRAAQELGLDLAVYTFEEGEHSMARLMEIYDDDEPIENFRAVEIDPEKVYAWLLCTSGTTGRPKIACFKHDVLIKQILGYMSMSKGEKILNKAVLNLSPVQWLSSFCNAVICPVLKQVKLQTSRPDDLDHIIDIINTYKPASLTASPTLLVSILKQDKECDLMCFDNLTICGAKTYKDTLIELRKRTKPGALVEIYGQTETIGPVLMPNPSGPIGNIGKPMPQRVLVKLVDPDTGADVTQPNIPGELWVKGSTFVEYYNNKEETENLFSPDGWYKTGDLMYRDENDNYFFVDRIKMVFKCRGYKIMPPELEEVINAIDGVLEVCVTSIPDVEDGQQAVAVVVRRPGCEVTAQQVKEAVVDKLSDKKQLRGGVAFVNHLPKTSTGKVARAKVKQMALSAHRE